ncbi:MAG: hypothetical protein H0U74_18545 [Bradymonadaceae bacterium]|nr:hypothetical protein [Lujinxingiaceae bacterium]
MKTFKHTSLWAMALLFCTLLFSGCASFKITTPDEMAEVGPQDKAYDYRALTVRGVVLGVRVISQGKYDDVPRANEVFWVDATRQRMRTLGGYALLSEEPVQSANGHSGTRLKFGRDQRGTTYWYWVTLFVTEDNIHVIDAGGRREHFEESQSVIEQALASYVVRD